VTFSVSGQTNCNCSVCTEKVWVANDIDAPENYSLKEKDTLKRSLRIGILIDPSLFGNVTSRDVKVTNGTSVVSPDKIKIQDIGHRVELILDYKKSKSECVNIRIDNSAFDLTFRIKPGYRHVDIYSENFKKYQLTYSNYPSGL
jgi:hypothetical protein